MVVVVVGEEVTGVAHRNLEEGPSDRPIPLLHATQAVCLLPLPPWAVLVLATTFRESMGGTYLKPDIKIYVVSFSHITVYVGSKLGRLEIILGDKVKNQISKNRSFYLSNSCYI